MTKEIADSLHAKKSLVAIADIEKMNNKLTNFSQRLLNTTALTTVHETNANYAMVWALEQVMDELGNICYYLQNCKNTKSILPLLRQLTQTCELFYRVYQKKTAESLWQLRQALDALGKQLQSQSTHQNVRMSVYALVGMLRHLSFSFG